MLSSMFAARIVDIVPWLREPPSPKARVQLAAEHSIQVPPGRVRQGAWIGDDIVFEVWDDTKNTWFRTIWTVPADGGRAPIQLELTPSGACSPRAPTAFTSPVRLPGNAIGYLESCAEPQPNGRSSVHTFMALDGGQGQAWSVELPSDPHIMRRGFVLTGESLLFTRDLESAKLIEVDIGDGSISESAQTPPVKRVGALAGSDHAQRVAFAGNKGPLAANPAISASLYVAETSFDDETILLGGLEGLSGLAFDPAGDRLAFAGRYRGVRGLYVMELERREVTRVAEGTFRISPSAWSGDGQSLVATEYHEPPAGTELFDIRLVILTVGR